MCTSWEAWGQDGPESGAVASSASSYLTGPIASWVRDGAQAAEGKGPGTQTLTWTLPVPHPQAPQAVSWDRGQIQVQSSPESCPALPGEQDDLVMTHTSGAPEPSLIRLSCGDWPAAPEKLQPASQTQPTTPGHGRQGRGQPSVPATQWVSSTQTDLTTGSQAASAPLSPVRPRAPRPPALPQAGVMTPRSPSRRTRSASRATQRGQQPRREGTRARGVALPELPQLTPAPPPHAATLLSGTTKHEGSERFHLQAADAPLT